VIPRVAAASARILILSWTASLGKPAELSGQVGLASGLGRVVLIARSASHGSIDSVGIPVQRSDGAGREIVVAVRVSANTAYRLSVIRNDTKDSPYGEVEVRGLSGGFQTVEWGTSILVGRGQAEAGTESLMVLYRTEAMTSSGRVPAPPVRYELAIAPQL
jgi:hypothetical protein